MPCPAGLVVKNGSNTRLSIGAGIPGPLSVTSAITRAPSRRVVTTMRPSRARSVPIACTALTSRLTNTCDMRPTLPMTCVSPSRRSVTVVRPRSSASAMRSEARTASLMSKGSFVLSSALARAPMSRMMSRIRLAPSTASEAARRICVNVTVSRVGCGASGGAKRGRCSAM